MDTCKYIRCDKNATERIGNAELGDDAGLCIHHRIMLTELRELYHAFERENLLIQAQTLRCITGLMLPTIFDGGHLYASNMRYCNCCKTYMLPTDSYFNELYCSACQKTKKQLEQRYAEELNGWTPTKAILIEDKEFVIKKLQL